MGNLFKGRADNLVLGDHNAVCYVCGFKRKASQLVKHWRGYWVCPEHWEPREAQDFVRATPDDPSPSWVQDRPAAVYTAFCTPEGNTAIADFAVADCVVAEYINPMFDYTVTVLPPMIGIQWDGGFAIWDNGTIIWY